MLPAPLRKRRRWFPLIIAAAHTLRGFAKDGGVSSARLDTKRLRTSTDLFFPCQLFRLLDQLGFLDESPRGAEDGLQFLCAEPRQIHVGLNSGVVQFLFDDRTDASDHL